MYGRRKLGGERLLAGHQEGLDHGRIELSTRTTLQLLDRQLLRAARAVGPVGEHGVECVGHRQDTALDTDLVAADLAGIGITILNPVQARANDLSRVKADTRGRTALHGAIDTALLASGTPESIRAEVIRVMEILKPGGGYVCAPDQDIPGIPPENMQALWDTAREVGRY